MGFLAPASKVVLEAAARVMAPPPPMDITKWCCDNIIFDERSSIPGPFNITLFPFLKEIHTCLNIEHESREVTIIGSAQWGKTVSIIQPVLGAWHEYGPLDSLVVHPTQASAAEWVDNKWSPMRRQAPSLRRTFGNGIKGDHRDAKFNQETAYRNGSIKIASAGSPADLTGTSRRLIIMDDVALFEMNDRGDPEALAENRASGYEDAKILAVSVPQVAGTCRITRRFKRSDQRYFYMPCPECGNEATFEWENFKKSIRPDALDKAHFTCESCGVIITHIHKERMLKLGKWVKKNPTGDHPGFHLWRAYAPQRDWASIAHDYARMMGWTGLHKTSSEKSVQESIEAETEQTFFNNVLGLPYEQATKGPDWEHVRNRIENAPDQDTLAPAIVPATGVILTAGVDCQDDRTEVHIVAFCANFRRHTVDYKIIPHHIGSSECHKALDAFLKNAWRTQLGLKLALDIMAIDSGAYTEDVWSFAKRHPTNRVIVVKGTGLRSGPVMKPMNFERRADGKLKRRQKRGFLLAVSQMKADFYRWLEVEDCAERGYCSFCRSLGDEFYRQLCSEIRVLKRNASGIFTSVWQLVEASRRNEVLDTMLYAEAAARRAGWANMTETQWTSLEAERSRPGEDTQSDLFEKVVLTKSQPPKPPQKTKKPERKKAPDSWLGNVGNNW